MLTIRLSASYTTKYLTRYVIESSKAFKRTACQTQSQPASRTRASMNPPPDNGLGTRACVWQKAFS